jgi:integrase
MAITSNFADSAMGLICSYKGKDHSFVTRAKFWVEHIGPEPSWEQITASHIEEGLAKYIQQGKTKVVRKGDQRLLVPTGEPLAPSSVNKLLMGFASLVKMAKARYILPKTYISPSTLVTKQKEGDGRYLEITKQEIERLVAVAYLARWKPLPALIATAASSGLRLGNLRALRWSNINFEGMLVSVPTSKNGTPYSCALSPLAIAELTKLKRATYQPEDLVFGNHYFVKSFKSAVKDAGLEHKLTCFHLLRHCAASLLAQAGFGEITIMSQLNQKQSSMARRYSHLSNQNLVSAVGKAWA